MTYFNSSQHPNVFVAKYSPGGNVQLGRHDLGEWRIMTSLSRHAIDVLHVSIRGGHISLLKVATKLNSRTGYMTFL